MPLAIGIGIGTALGGRAISGPFISLSATSVAEDATVGTTIGTLSVVGGTGSWTFSETADPDSKFTVDGTALKSSAAFDYETKTSHPVTIEATDGTSTIQRVFTITVTNVLEVTLSALTLSDTTAEPGEAWSATINGKSSGSTVAAVSSDGTVLSVVGATVSGTFTTEGVPNVTLTEAHPDGSNSPRQSVVSVTVAEVEPSEWDIDDTVPYQITINAMPSVSPPEVTGGDYEAVITG